MDACDRYDSLIRFYADRYQRDARQVKRQIRSESGFDPDAKSPVGAVGLAQFMPRTWDEWRDGTAGIQAPPSGLRLVDPRDPEDAISAMCAYMGALQALLGSLPSALAAYNWGPGNVRAAKSLGEDWRAALPVETRVYVKKCLDFGLESIVG